MTMRANTILGIHRFLHFHKQGSELKFNEGNSAKIHVVGIMTTATNCKYMFYDGVTFVEQPLKDTFFGNLAKKGRQITWGYRKKDIKPVLKIVDNTLYVNGVRHKGDETVII